MKQVFHMVVSTWVHLTGFYYEKHTFYSSLTRLFTLPLCRPTAKNENLGISWWARWAQDGSGRTQNICFQMFFFFSPNVIYFCSIVCLSTENKQIYKPTMHTFDVRCLELRLTVFKRLHWGSCKDGPCLFWVPSSKVWKPRVCFMFHTAGNRTPEFLLNGVSNVCPLGFGRRFWGGHEKEIAVGLLKMADGN